MWLNIPNYFSRYNLGFFFLKVLSKNYLISLVYIYLFKIRYYFLPKSRDRKHLNLFEYKLLSSKCINNNISEVRDSNMYGIQEVIEEFLNIKLGNLFFEHGIIFGNYATNNLKNTFANIIVTYGPYRQKILREIVNKDIIAIGPFIHYAKEILSNDEFRNLKSSLGRVLLVFPTHSVKSVDNNYDVEDFCNSIIDYKDSYDTTLVCLYWKDIELGKDKFYTNKGFKVVTAGYFWDSHFLSRLKTIINLSDMVMANDTGTFLGYCIYLNKPVYVYKQEILPVTLDENAKIELNQRSLVEQEDYIQIKSTLSSAFGDFNECISINQYQICNEIWGFNQIKTRDELIKELKL